MGLPTVLSAAQCDRKPINNIDGFNLWPFMSAEPEMETGSEIETKPEVKKRKEIPMQINPLLKLHEKDYRAFNTRWDTRMQGVMIKGDMKLVVGSYSILRRRHHSEKTVHLFNITEDTNEEWDLSDRKVGLAVQMMNKLADLLPEAKEPWHPLPDPKSDPDLNGGFWGPYQVDEVIEEEEEEYEVNYEYDHYSETTEVQDQPEVPW